MPAGYSEWPGPRDAEEGQEYTRAGGPGDANVFRVETVTEHEDGRVSVSGAWREV